MRRRRSSQCHRVHARSGVMQSVMQQEVQVQVPVQRWTNSTGLGPKSPVPRGPAAGAPAAAAQEEEGEP